MLGISYYLTKDQFYNMVNRISKLICKGSTIVFDYPIIEDSEKEEITRKLAKGANEEMKAKQNSYLIRQVKELPDLQLTKRYQFQMTIKEN